MPPEPIATAAWRRLDLPGHDAAQVVPHGDGWRLYGVAVCVDGGRPVGLAYEVVCGPDWVARTGSVRGFAGHRFIDWRVARENGRWSLNDRPVPGLDHCLDLDFGFTPATNFTQIRRMDLAAGQSAEAPVAWIDVGEETLTELRQTYTRRSATAYAYVAARFDYAERLQLLPSGFVRSYPGLWEAEGG